jgi:hypothetical protein
VRNHTHCEPDGGQSIAPEPATIGPCELGQPLGVPYIAYMATIGAILPSSSGLDSPGGYETLINLPGWVRGRFCLCPIDGSPCLLGAYKMGKG